MNSKSSPTPGSSEVGGVDKTESNAGVRLTDEQAAPPSSSKRDVFLIVWLPPLVIGFFIGLFISEFLATCLNEVLPK